MPYMVDVVLPMPYHQIVVALDADSVTGALRHTELEDRAKRDAYPGLLILEKTILV